MWDRRPEPDPQRGWGWKSGRTQEEKERGDSEGLAKQEMGVACSWPRGEGRFPPASSAGHAFPAPRPPVHFRVS